ncbi:hypothetical protein GDO86_019853 [Hymenochirus boettgeri]|uniref:Uncharacterized protein n=1 Tax=Hymenochirus boettgeri TaxID=247094 RepID=A0A8T2IAE9_9PIPI|nr:hypothetical protein GDO86_019853 [Hymenochirus boettgeri]
MPEVPAYPGSVCVSRKCLRVPEVSAEVSGSGERSENAMLRQDSNDETEDVSLFDAEDDGSRAQKKKKLRYF